MEIARRVSKLVLVFFLFTSSLWSHALQAKSISFTYTFSDDLQSIVPAEQLNSINAFALSLLQSAAPTVSFESKSATQKQKGQAYLPHIIFNLVRTKENELEYDWISPILAYECSELFACTPNAGSQEIDVGVAYIALAKTGNSLRDAEWLSEKVSEFKTSSEFDSQVSPLIAQLSKDFPNSVEKYGLVSLVGELHADTSNLWVIADLVPLFSDLSERGELEGIAADFVREVLHEMGMSDAILSAPWKRIAKEATTKSNVLVFSVIRTDERDDVFHWVTPVSKNLHGLFGIDKPRFAAIQDVPKTYRVGTLAQDYRYDIALDLGFQVKAYESWQALVDGLFRNDIDVLFGSQGAVDIGCNPDGLKCETIKLTSEYDISTAYLALSKTDTCVLVLEKLKLASAKARKSKKYNEQLSAWSEMVSQSFGIAHHTENGVVHLWNPN